LTLKDRTSPRGPECLGRHRIAQRTLGRVAQRRTLEAEHPTGPPAQSRDSALAPAGPRRGAPPWSSSVAQDVHQDLEIERLIGDEALKAAILVVEAFNRLVWLT
jgi:hypothetical protein